jgi:hypothetical protein
VDLPELFGQVHVVKARRPGPVPCGSS